VDLGEQNLHGKIVRFNKFPYFSSDFPGYGNGNHGVGRYAGITLIVKIAGIGVIYGGRIIHGPPGGHHCFKIF